jgi:hypothetical protein
LIKKVFLIFTATHIFFILVLFFKIEFEIRSVFILFPISPEHREVFSNLGTGRGRRYWRKNKYRAQTFFSLTLRTRLHTKKTMGPILELLLYFLFCNLKEIVKNKTHIMLLRYPNINILLIQFQKKQIFEHKNI